MFQFVAIVSIKHSLYSFPSDYTILFNYRFYFDRLHYPKCFFLFQIMALSCVTFIHICMHFCLGIHLGIIRSWDKLIFSLEDNVKQSSKMIIPIAILTSSI